MKLTTTTVRTAALPAGTTDAIIFDEEIPGFGLRIREAGSRSFIFQYKLGSKQRRMALGAATLETVATARKNATKLHARVKLGEDPASDKVEKKREASETFLPAAEEFLALNHAARRAHKEQTRSHPAAIAGRRRDHRAATAAGRSRSSLRHRAAVRLMVALQG